MGILGTLFPSSLLSLPALVGIPAVLAIILPLPAVSIWPTLRWPFPYIVAWVLYLLWSIWWAGLGLALYWGGTPLPDWAVIVVLMPLGIILLPLLFADGDRDFPS